MQTSTSCSPAVSQLCSKLQAAFAAERRRGEAINYTEQSPESFARLDAGVRAAIREFEAAKPEGVLAALAPFLHFNPSHYTRNSIVENDDFELL